MHVGVETVEIPHLLLVEKIVMIPEIQMIQGPQTSESSSGEITVARKIDHETVVRGVAQNVQIDSFMDDFSIVDNEGLNHQDCEVPSRVGKQSGSTHQQHTLGQSRNRRRERRGRERRGKKEEGEKEPG